jgi:hypothetical protein
MLLLTTRRRRTTKARCGLTEQRQIEMAHRLMMPAHRKKQTEYLEKIPSHRDHSRIQVSAARGVVLAIPGDVGEATDGESGPASLMAGTETSAGFAVEVFVEIHEVAPMRVGREARIVAVAWTAAIFIRQKDTGKTRAKFERDFAEIHHLT